MIRRNFAMRPFYFGLALFTATSLTAAAQQSTLDCAVLAMTNYNKASLALTQNQLGGSVETKMAERRLEEQYCLEIAKCEMQKHASEPWYQMGLSTAFSNCLLDEAEEELKHASRPKRKK
jgi:hypothetical protein